MCKVVCHSFDQLGHPPSNAADVLRKAGVHVCVSCQVLSAILAGGRYKLPGKNRILSIYPGVYPMHPVLIKKGQIAWLARAIAQ